MVKALLTEEQSTASAPMEGSISGVRPAMETLLQVAALAITAAESASTAVSL